MEKHWTSGDPVWIQVDPVELAESSVEMQRDLQETRFFQANLNFTQELIAELNLEFTPGTNR